MSTALVTGGNRGIGQQLSRELAQRGWDVIAASRDLKKGEAAAARLRKETGGRVRSLELDVTNPATLADAHRRLRDGNIRLDALVNNAGVYGNRDAKTTLETNFFGPVRVIEALRDRLNPGARIVNVTSGLGALSNLNDAGRRALTDPALTREALVARMEQYLERGESWGTDAYGVSKAALNALSRVYAKELAPQGIKVNSTCPGWVRTEMGGRNAPRTVEEGAASVLWGVLLGADGPSGGVFRDGKPAE